jgi:CRISPR-associated protein Csx14
VRSGLLPTNDPAPDEAVLVATLGGQPQVVTFTLDCLLAQGERPVAVYIVYLSGAERYRNAFACLEAEFRAGIYEHTPLQAAPVRQQGRALAEACTPGEVEAVRTTVSDLFAKLKQEGSQVHVSLSGGRRIMALTAIAAAMRYLTPADRIWHLYTPPELAQRAQEGALLHALEQPGPRLIDVPFVPWAAYFPALRSLLDPGAHLAAAWLPHEEVERCQQAWMALTPRQREVLRSISEGYTRAQTASALRIAVSTVDSHLRAIQRKCEVLWPSERIQAGFLRARFGPWLASKVYGDPL